MTFCEVKAVPFCSGGEGAVSQGAINSFSAKKRQTMTFWIIFGIYRCDITATPWEADARVPGCHFMEPKFSSCQNVPIQILPKKTNPKSFSAVFPIVAFLLGQTLINKNTTTSLGGSRGGSSLPARALVFG